ncbi:UDP-3-O-(3-hydroxymyristoyl)glucosamine N-acyltransferase [Streptomyces sp. NPDC127119]|uniref:UDP-3-O-(3-hydroxymyristoyl)glucosamine N-acyltransferase n=1 Tax=Streptomyces sp. NPDC127119 TaxID=3345370 RepID=UPI00363DA194
MHWSLGEIAEAYDGSVCGDAGMRVRPTDTRATDPSGLAYAERASALERMAGVGAFLLPRALTGVDRPHVHVDDPRDVFHQLLGELDRRAAPAPPPGVHPTAVTDPDCAIDPTAYVGPYTVVERGAVIGPRTRIHPFVYVGPNCRVGADSVLHPHAVLCRDVRLGERCTVHPGAVVGGEGFGFTPTPAGWRRVPQAGGVRAGDDVEIRALASVERATCADTVLGDGVKLGDLTCVGHNATLGDHTLLVPLSGVGGSATLGRRCVLGGGSGVFDHTTLADDVRVGAHGTVTRDIDTPGDHTGTPARPLARQLRLDALLPRLPELLERIRQLEERLDAGR